MEWGGEEPAGWMVGLKRIERAKARREPKNAKAKEAAMWHIECPLVTEDKSARQTTQRALLPEVSRVKSRRPAQAPPDLHASC